MKSIVLKVGGSNLKDIDSLQKVITLVKAYKRPVVLVVSAFYGVTDKIISTVEKNTGKRELLNELKEIHFKALDRYIKKEPEQTEAKNKVNGYLTELDELFNLDTNEPSVANKIISYGERISSVVIAEILNANGVAISSKFPEEIGFYSNSRYFQGTINLKRSAKSISNYLSKEKSYVIPGFYGIDKKGDTVLLGRGGSDYSAAAIAYCLDAEYLDIWKDVEGYLSADPKLIPNVKKINKLSYLEAAELSYFGAKILHPRTIRPLVKKGIEIRLFNPDKHKEPVNEATLISNHSETSEKVIKSITHSDNIALLKLKGSGVGIKKGILAEVTGALDDARINIRSVVTSQTAIHFIFQKEDLAKAKSIVDNINKNNDFDTEIEDNIAWIAAIGNGINEREGVAARIFTALAKKSINVKSIVLGASEVAIYFIVDKKDVKNAVKAINDELFDNRN